MSHQLQHDQPWIRATQRNLAIGVVFADIGGVDRAVAELPAGHVSGDESGVGDHAAVDHAEREKTAGRFCISVAAVADDVVSIVVERGDDP